MLTGPASARGATPTVTTPAGSARNSIPASAKEVASAAIAYLHFLLLFPPYFPSLLFLLLFSSVSYDLLYPIPHHSATMGNSPSDMFHSRAPTSLSTSRSGLHNILSAQTRHFVIHNMRSVTRYTYCHIYCTVFLDCQNLSLDYVYCISLTF